MPIALVLGFSLPGLAIARALAGAGIEVHAISEPSDSPALSTRFATVHVREGVNSSRLVSILLEFAVNHLRGRKAVLFPTSDNMVEALARGWPELEPHFLLSWAHCRELVLTLLRKQNLPAICERQGMR